MIKVTIFNEFVQEQLDCKRLPFMAQWNCSEETWQKFADNARTIRAVHPEGIHGTLKALLEQDSEIAVCRIANLENIEQTLTEEVLCDTDVLIWWSHFAQKEVPDYIAERVQSHVLKGMGLMVLHSGHMCKPMGRLLGTSCTLRWREGDREKLWCVAPCHPIARGVAECIELEQEEMYGEFFDIPTPDALLFLGNFSGGEVFRSGCIWNRGWGKLFYFQPGHETCPSYHHPEIQKILRNAVHYLAQPGIRRENLDCLAV